MHAHINAQTHTGLVLTCCDAHAQNVQ